MNKFDIFKFKFVNFILQILILSLFIYLFNYEFKIDYDQGISSQRREIIQFLANYILFDLSNIIGLLFIYLSWLFVSLIPILNFKDYKKAYSMNLSTFFFPNFFFYVFLYRYSFNYFNSEFLTLITRTIILGFIIVIFSINISLVIKKLTKPYNETIISDLKLIESKNKIKCPQCGTEFDSITIYCYNCLKKLKENNIADSKN
jgi:hypothetical protein